MLEAFTKKLSPRFYNFVTKGGGLTINGFSPLLNTKQKYAV
jgi:hypothetical protein